MDQDTLRLRLAVVCATAFIIAGFALSYFLWGHDGLPIGWDSPHYVEQSKIVASQGPLALISIQGPYDFFYQLFSGFVVWCGVPAIELEIFLPIALAAMIPFPLSRFALFSPDKGIAAVIALAAPGWYAIGYIAADKHANLLGLVLLLAAIPLLFRTNSIKAPQSFLGLALIGIASFTHIETTLFLVTIIFIASAVFSTFRPIIALSAVAVSFPASILYVMHFLQLISLTGYSLPVYSLEPVWYWLLIFGALLPIAIYGLLAPIIGGRSKLELLAIIWAACSLVVGISQYFDAQVFTFAQRAAPLVPAPILAAIGFVRIRSWANKVRPETTRPRNLQKWVLVTAFVLLILSWPLTYVATAYQYQGIYLSSSAYQRLEWISNNVRFADTPIFVYNDLDLNAGGLGDLYSNWVGAIVGTHLSYLGRVDYLVQLQQTPYSNVVSRLHSAVFMKEISDAGITNQTILLMHRIIIIKDFYNPFPIPTYISGFFKQVSDGVLEGDSMKLATLNNFTLPLSSALVDSIGPWNSIQRSWAQSIYALEATVKSTPTNLDASFLLEIPSNGTYTPSVRYWDGIGNDLEVLLDGIKIGTVNYTGSNIPLTGNFAGIYLTSGIHRISIKIDQNPSTQQYASLDYLAMTRS